MSYRGKLEAEIARLRAENKWLRDTIANALLASTVAEKLAILANGVKER